MILPSKTDALTRKAKDVIEACMASQQRRVAAAKVYNSWIETGSAAASAGGMQRSLINMLYSHVDRLSSHLFSPTSLRFSIDYDHHYEKPFLLMADTAARQLTRTWERRDIDMVFASGVTVSNAHGAAILKQGMGHAGVEARLLMPWQFGVYNEELTGLGDQEAVCESGYMTAAEVWRRISHMDGAEGLYRRIMAHASKGSDGATMDSFFHQVLSTSVLNTDMSNTSTRPGGIVQLANAAAFPMSGAEIAVDTVKYHELWVRDEDMGDGVGDYCTLIVLEPDILISSRLKKQNLFVPQTLPYSLIQSNHSPGNFWGRSEIEDLMEPQGLLSRMLEDIRQVLGVQFRKVLAFEGYEGVADELYDQLQTSGAISLNPGARVNDLTPALPPDALKMVELTIKLMNDVSGFSGVMSGQGESGVRAGVHAETLLKTGSPRLRDRALLIERQCADAADRTLDLMQAKDATVYRTALSEATVREFTLSQLPDDRHVTVDSHSASPIYEDSHKDLVSFGLKAGIIQGDSAIDMLPFPEKDVLKARWREAQQKKEQMLREHPELLDKGGKGKK